MKKILLRWLVILVIFLPCTIMVVSAAERAVVDNGFCGGEGDGKNLAWTLYEDGELIVCGTGAMADYSDGDNQPWRNDTFGIKTVTIQDGVTNIGGRAFSVCEELTNVVIGDDVSAIGPSAFYRCFNLEKVTIGDGVAVIGDHAFESCYGLVDLTMGTSVTSIGVKAFARCGIPTVTLFDNVIDIGEMAFFDCSRLAVVTLGDKLTTIGENAFSCCASLVQITIPNSVTTIGGSAFAFCLSLVEVDLGDGVSAIGDGAFLGCANLKTVAIPDSVSAVGNMAFADCDALETVDLGNGIVTLGDWVFDCCFSLNTVTIPSTVTTIGEGVFSSCTNLTAVEVDVENKHYRSLDGVLYTANKSVLLSYPAGIDRYAFVVPMETKEIANGAFLGCKLRELHLPRSVERLGEFFVGWECEQLVIYANRNYPAFAAAEEMGAAVCIVQEEVGRGIVVAVMPKQRVFTLGTVDFAGLNVVGVNNQPVDLAKCEIAYDPCMTGIQEVTVRYQGRTTTFEILIYDEQEQTLLDFVDCVIPNGNWAFVAIYDEAGRMISVERVVELGGKTQMVVDNVDYGQADQGKLVVLSRQTFAPTGSAISKQL